jgi:uncharacterized membrane protein
MISEQRITEPLDRSLSRANDSANVGDAERLASLLGGGALALYGLTRRTPAGLALALLGGALLYRGAAGRSNLYRSLGVNTAQTSGSAPIHVEQALTINRPAEELYRYWHNLENLPTFMRHLEMVRTIDDRHSHWTAKTPMGSTVDWAAEITDDQPNRLLAWRSLPEADVTNTGTVRFHEAPGNRGTEVHMAIDYAPPGGALGSAFATLFGEAPEQQIADDLRRFKQLMETGEVATVDGQPAGQRSAIGKLLNQGKDAPTGGGQHSASAETSKPRKKDLVMETSEESFPASDPPSWTGSAAGAEREAGA